MERHKHVKNNCVHSCNWVLLNFHLNSHLFPFHDVTEKSELNFVIFYMFSINRIAFNFIGPEKPKFSFTISQPWEHPRNWIWSVYDYRLVTCRYYSCVKWHLGNYGKRSSKNKEVATFPGFVPSHDTTRTSILSQRQSKSLKMLTHGILR